MILIRRHLRPRPSLRQLHLPQSRVPLAVLPTFLVVHVTVILLAGSAAAQSTSLVPPPDPLRRVITRSVIERTGITRPGEIFDLLPEWDSWSTDGLHDRHRVSSLAPLRTDTFLLFIDGMRIDHDLLETRSLNLLPLTVAEIDSVEFIAYPALVAGTFAARGAVHIHTRRPGRGPEMTAALFAENETGDTGPWRYLEGRRQDVEHIGPEGEIVLGWGGERAWLRLAGLNRNHPVTDENIYSRTVALARELPVVTTRAANLRAHVEIGPSRHDVSASTQWGHDFLFHRGPGQEIAADTRLRQIGAAGTIPLTGSFGLRYRLGRSAGTIGSWAPLGGPNRELELDRRYLNIEFGNVIPAGGLCFGLTRETSTIGRGRDVQNDDHTESTLYISAHRLGSSRWSTDLDVAAVLRGRETRLSTNLQTCLQVIPNIWIRFAAAQTPVSFFSDHGYRYWTSNLEFDLLPVSLPGFTYYAGITDGCDHDALQSRLAAIDLALQANPTAGMTISGGFFHRQFTDLRLERYMSTDTTTKFGWAGCLPEAGWDGRLSGARGDLALDLNGRVSLSLAGEYRLRRRGFTARMRAIPRLIVTGRIEYVMHPTMTLALTGRYASRSAWTEYPPQPYDDPYQYSGMLITLPGMNDHPVLTLTAAKWFWDRRLRLVLVGRNLLNRTYRTHPAGAGFDLSLAARLELYLGRDR